MKKMCLLVLLASALGCAGGASDEFDGATPSFDTVSLDISDADAAPDSTDANAASDFQLLGAGNPCHPHLFLRAHAIVEATNGGVWRVLRPLGRVIGITPRVRNGKTHVWERVVDGFTWKYDVEKTGTASFTATLQVKRATDPDTAFVTVYSADVQRDPAAHDGSGTAALDLDALQSVVGGAESGKLSLDFTLDAASKKVVVTLTNYTFSGQNARTGKYVFFKEFGKGGSLKFVDTLHLGCPGPGGAATGTTPVETVARWIQTSSGSIHFRGDALATGGQVAAGDRWMGVTCAQSTDRAHQPGETYWLMKLEDATGATVQGSSRQSTQATAAACDAAFGPVPAIDNPATDFAFGSVDFASDAPLPFPGM
jgi:hypothetical protein